LQQRADAAHDEHSDAVDMRAVVLEQEGGMSAGARWASCKDIERHEQTAVQQPLCSLADGTRLLAKDGDDFAVPQYKMNKIQ
jgi:hypothetical protein